MRHHGGGGLGARDMNDKMLGLIVRACLFAALVASGLSLVLLYWRTVILGNLFGTAPFNAAMVTLGLIVILAVIIFLASKLFKGKHHA